MDRETARKILQYLRQGNQEALKDYFRAKALEARAECQHCGHRVLPIQKGYDFKELTMSFDCPLCGKRNTIGMKSFPDGGPLQTPPG